VPRRTPLGELRPVGDDSTSGAVRAVPKGRQDLAGGDRGAADPGAPAAQGGTDRHETAAIRTDSHGFARVRTGSHEPARLRTNSHETARVRTNSHSFYGGLLPVTHFLCWPYARNAAGQSVALRSSDSPKLLNCQIARFDGCDLSPRPRRRETVALPARNVTRAFCPRVPRASGPRRWARPAKMLPVPAGRRGCGAVAAATPPGAAPVRPGVPGSIPLFGPATGNGSENGGNPEPRKQPPQGSHESRRTSARMAQKMVCCPRISPTFLRPSSPPVTRILDMLARRPGVLAKHARHTHCPVVSDCASLARPDTAGGPWGPEGGRLTGLTGCL